MARVVMGAQQLVAGKGGIARVGRMCAAALEQQNELHLFAVNDEQSHLIGNTPVRAFSGNRLSFALSLNRALLGADLAIYDFPGTGRAHFIPNRPYVVWVHGNEIWNDPTIRKDYTRVIKGAERILVNSAFTEAALQKALGPLSNVRKCWLATENEDEPEPSPKKDGPPTLLFIGRSDEYFAKGQDTVVRLWPGIVSHLPDARLVLVSDGVNAERLKALAAASPVADNIDFLGFVPEEEISTLWQTASALVLLGNLEGFGLVVVEAMRHSVPVITSTQDACCEINGDGETGYNLDRNNDEAITETIRLVLKDRELARRLGAAGLKRWRSHFRPSLFRQRFLKCLGPLVTS